MNRINLLHRPIAAMALLAGMMLSSCNKNIPDPTPIAYPVPTSASVGELLNDANFSYLKAGVTRAGLLPALLDKNTKYTVFAPDNTAFNRLFAALGLPQAEATVSALPLTTLVPILQYHVVPGQTLTSSMITEAYPNTFMPTMLQASAASPLLKLTNFPSRRGSTAFVNNVPVAQADIQAANGVVHRMAGVIVPPDTRTILQALQADTSYSFLVAAVLRADQGLPSGSKVSELLGNPTPYANFTLFAPPNSAFRAFYRAFGIPNPTPASINLFTVNTAVSVVAYHVHIRGVLGAPPSVSPDLIRVFSTNLPATPTQAATFLSMLAPTAPRLTISASTGVKGTGNPVPATITRPDWHQLNGVIHAINQVLIPQ
jgi:uncharacterized surface protein with fasciclin (FAS1) repeats